MAYCTVFKVLHSKILQSCCGNYLNGRPLYGSGEGHIYSMMHVNSYNTCMADGRFCKAYAAENGRPEFVFLGL